MNCFKSLRFLLICSLVGVACLAWASEDQSAQGDCPHDYYLAGAAQADITGPVVGLGMMGYANLQQLDQGLHMRLRARALVVTGPCSQQTVAVVIDDLGMIFNGVKQAVIDRLSLSLPGVFRHGNLLLGATHTHSGPGGFANYTLYNITTRGFSPKNFEAIVAGTTEAILKAYRQRQAATLTLTSGDLPGIQFNRSPEAYANNPEAERARYAADVDPAMSLLRVVGQDERPIAAFSWYPIHGVSLPMSNKLVSGDNKGLASYLFERKLGTTYRRDQEFIAAFAQSNAGDVSPYPLVESEMRAVDGFARNQLVAERQAERAMQLFASAAIPIQGPIQSVHRFENLAYRALAGGARTCNGALGVSFAAGTENGKPFPYFYEGTVFGLNWPRLTLMPKEQACHAEKVILFPTGFAKPSPWTAQVAPFQIVRIGNLALIAAPFEITTMAGRRLREHIAALLAQQGIEHVLLSSLANEYLHYVTTPEEYAKQAYEGGSNLFGPHSLTAYTEIFASLSADLQRGIDSPSAAVPRAELPLRWRHEPKPWFETVPRGRHFGEPALLPNRAYRPGDEVAVEFYGGHLGHGTPSGGSFLTVEVWQDGAWLPQYFDWDPETRIQQRRRGLMGSLIRITWQTQAATKPGFYRICHRGHYQAWRQKGLKAYQGCTPGFELLP